MTVLTELTEVDEAVLDEADTIDSADSPRRARRRPARRSSPVRRGRRIDSASVADGLRAGRRKLPVIIPIMLLILGALGLILVLSTRAAQDSYGLEIARTQNQTLRDQRDELKRTVDQGNSAPELAEAAGGLGMVPNDNPARLTVGADGKSHLQGELTAATGKKLPSLNPAPDPASDVDPDKVFDSRGLPGSTESDSQTQTQTQNQTQTQQTQSQSQQNQTQNGPAATDETVTEDSGTAGGQLPAAPNVLPPSATPGTNTTR